MMKYKSILLLLALSTPSAAAKAPNFILIYTDDLGYADTSVQMMDDDPSTKHSFIQTRGLDRLAALGARFTAAYAPSPTCTASRISIQMGKTTARMQYRNVFDVLSHVQRPNGYDDETTMGEMFKESGRNYVTAMFGKGASALGRFEDAGYDVTDELPGEPGGNGNGHGQYWDPKNKTPFPADNPKRIHSLRKDSVAFVNEHAGEQPFFLMVSHYAAHIPYLATKEAFERNKKRWIAEGRDTENIELEKSSSHRDIIYAAMIEELDMNVGALIDALVAKGELENTYIIFTSDNGGGHAERRKVNGQNRRFNGPLQEGKRSIYEGGIRVPTVISGPGIKAGSQCDVPIVQWDFLPTFHDLSGSQAPLPEGVDGGSLRDVFAHGNEGTVERAAPGIIHHYPCHYHPPISSIILGDYKFMRHLNSGETKLFNIKTDYREQHDLSTEMPEKVSLMDRIRANYVHEVNGGSAQQVRDALYDTMDTFGERAKEAYQKKLSSLKEQNPTDFDAKKAIMLEELNMKLMKNEVNKEKCRRQAKYDSWRESAPKKDAEEFVLSTWVDYTGE
ncbi:MAG: sulfatase-like hydrolase/transferase [Rubripirellula sp.]|nr:sulfatase-like hydrolase/transferase [Rubripirellula sp.]